MARAVWKRSYRIKESLPFTFNAKLPDRKFAYTLKDMKTTIIITVLTSIFFVNCFGCQGEKLSRTADFAPQGVNEDSLQTSSAARICAVERMSGGDVGAKINACDKMLGAQSGEIRLTGGGNIATQVVVSTGHTLRVVSGNYTATTNG